MQTSNASVITANNQANDFFFRILCRCKFLEFQIIISKIGIIHLSFSREIHHKAVQRVRQLMPEAELSLAVKKIDHVKDQIKKLLDTGQEKPAPDFDRNPFLKDATPFQQKIWRMISQLKPGETATYGQLAAAAGSPGGARAVGRACHQNPLALIIPCHRIVAADGPGGFAGDLATKLQLLEIDTHSRNELLLLSGDIKCSIVN